ncbi:MAG: hypothetical protein OEM59_14335, partial [Rhodospirillales bacterium]|nr:hypothetical protein [Rhodospirillales bacterium]
GKYGYALLGFEESGFRLGPVVNLSYVDLDLEIVAPDVGLREEIKEKILIPSLGFHGELPIGDLLLEADASGVYVNFKDIDGAYFRGDASVAWRPLPYVGLVAGYRVNLVDGHVSDVEFSTLLHGPVVGLELRY